MASVCTGRRRRCVSGVLVIVLFAVITTIYWRFRTFLHRDPTLYDPVWGEEKLTTSKPYVDYINPDNANFKRMFYNGDLVRINPFASESVENSATIGTPEAVVRVFEFKGSNFNACLHYVTFRVPKNLPSKLCIYNPEEDKIISSYIRDNREWEIEHVEAMAYLLHSREIYSLGENATNGYFARRSMDKTKIANTPTPVDPANSLEAQRQGSSVSLVDVGCNLGVYTFSAAIMGYNVLAIDPVQDSLKLLASSLRRANLTGRATLLWNAVSDARGLVTVDINPENIGGSSVRHVTSEGKRSGDAATVAAICLDDLVPYVRTRHVFLKLDIEGFEARALRCASGFFQTVDVSFVLMEWVFHRKSKDGAVIIDFLTKNGLLPYSDIWQWKLLNPDKYHFWPDNVFWIKR